MDITTILTFFAKDAQEIFTKAVLQFFEPFRARLASKFAKKNFSIIPYRKQNTQNLTLISNPLKKLRKKLPEKSYMF
jgi:hypothetical protein